MKKFNQILLGVGFFAIAGVASATQIQGSIGFVGSYDIHNGVIDDTSVATHDATLVDSFILGDRVDIIDAQVGGMVTGDFAAEGIVSGQAATYSDFIFDPVGSVSGLWSVGSFTFDLVSMVEYLRTDAFLVLGGSGWISSTTAGLDQTFGLWSFSANTTGSNFTWSASSAAPEPGIALLLGVGLIGFGVSRKLRKAA
ncbi:MAG: PEP-CTERM sorting domain-containing protein [Gammaproteobacteria bacterium]|nr:PEP-CTERM sorting domain-containing protein [Gammaproteobacteria bacterium]